MGAETYLPAVLTIWGERGEETTCPVSGDSMAPIVRHGDLVIIRHGERKLRRGDIVLLRQGGSLLVHRLVARRKTRAGEFLYTKGDRSGTCDPPVRPDQVLGRVIEVQGPKGTIRLTSRFWVVSNYVLAAVSALSARRPGREPRGRHVPRFLKAIRSRAFPRRSAVQSVLGQALCSLCRACSSGGARRRRANGSDA